MSLRSLTPCLTGSFVLNYGAFYPTHHDTVQEKQHEIYEEQSFDLYYLLLTI